MPVAYPTGLRQPLRASRSRRQPAAFEWTQPRRGLGYAQPIGSGVPVLWDVQWRLTQDEAATFLRWFTEDLDRGLLEFEMPIRTEFGLSNYACQFLPDALLTAREEGALWTYTATIHARELVVPEPPIPDPMLLDYVERVLSVSVTSIQTAARNVPTGTNILVFAGQNTTSPVVTISDTAGNTYTEANYYDGSSPSGGWFYCLNATGSSTLQITASSNTSQRMAIVAMFFSGDTPLTYATTAGSAGGFDTSIGPFSEAERSLTVACFYTSSGLATVTLAPSIFAETYNLLTDSGNTTRGRFGYILDADGFSNLTITATFDVGRTNAKAAAVFTY